MRNNRIQIFIKEIFIRLSYSFLGFFITIIVCFYYIDSFYFFIIKPFFIYHYNFSWCINFYDPSRLLNISFFIASFFSLSFNIIIYLIHFFIFFCNSLRKYEYIILLLYFGFSYIFYIFSIYFSFNFFLPYFWNFIVTFFTLPFISCLFLPIADTYLSISVFIIFFISINFQIPILIFFIFYYRFFSFTTLFYYKKIFYFLFFIYASVFSPPDVMSQLVFSGFFVFFFEFFCFFFLFYISFLSQF
ncbi:hypothetical protein AB834_01865 [PVC group bacterium (ex Bugula neritina AB1)]|nr:hypothetical protein AB834_01865 [PVC group bacterium (ex Bugula neritina AB1)]